MKNNKGFSLIEIVVVMGILALLIAGAFFIGMPQYDRYVIYSERDYLVDSLLESRARAIAAGTPFFVSTWSNGYCIKDSSGLCVVPAHDLPTNMTLTKVDFASSTEITLAFTDDAPQSTLRAEINIDQYGFIDGE